MSAIFSLFLNDIIESAVADFDGVMLWLLDGMLHVELLMDAAVSGVVTNTVISDVYQFIYMTAGGLLVLKFLFKGFEIYILWRDGDPENSPQDMLIGSIQGTVVMLVFPYLYDVMAEITLWFATGIMERLDLSTGGTFHVTDFQIAGKSIVLLIMALVYLILMVIMIIKLMQRGFELLILRLGVPIACMGLIDSDKGLFKGYIQIFYKTLFTSVIQIVLLSWSLRFIANPSVTTLVIGIAIISTALSTPMLMQQMLISTGRGGGIGQKMYSAGMMANAVRRIIGK